MQSGLVEKKVSVWHLVCMSVKRVDYAKTEKICPDFYTIRKII